MRLTVPSKDNTPLSTPEVCTYFPPCLRSMFVIRITCFSLGGSHSHIKIGNRQSAVSANGQYVEESLRLFNTGSHDVDTTGPPSAALIRRDSGFDTAFLAVYSPGLSSPLHSAK
ncbi:hypothetical protein IscW_ISCW012834 [Ixodes scapularis]|uniref:Uncharacterized protein n=1 Tax=Ixodes scapularis TaxID=6945 RepID=B7QEJ3_IXOSC|nr:hypothetical protein IscW_ISCW012834 [Ixodes scapularis]|eukprot:XP_002413957.1 hypothetical protein IscW_ISCW012834 [Ixodes scapularis]